MRAHLGLGSNLETAHGGPRDCVNAAIAALAGAPAVRLEGRSRIYRTEPVGPPQPDFANAVVELETALSPEEILGLCQALEREFGRRRDLPLGPRTLDVDLLLVGDERRAGSGLELPHPRLHRRRFVLVPLAEVAPRARHPVLGLTVAELLQATADRSRVEPWEGSG